MGLSMDLSDHHAGEAPGPGGGNVTLLFEGTDGIKEVGVATVTSPVGLWTAVFKPPVWHLTIFGCEGGAS